MAAGDVLAPKPIVDPSHLIEVCRRCGIVVGRGRDSCPNVAGFGDQSHPLTRYVRFYTEDGFEAARRIRGDGNEAGRIAERTVQQVALGSVEAAIACLESAKGCLQR